MAVRRGARWVVCLLAAACSSSSGGGAGSGDAEPPPPLPSFMPQAAIFVNGPAHDGVVGADCRVATNYCRHNENTDMIAWNGGIWLVHRTAISQQLGPNSALHVYESTDGGKTFPQKALIPAPTDRDIRDPAFFIVGGKLYMKALERLPNVMQARDLGTDTVSVVKTSADGVNWTSDTVVAPHGWAFWRVKESAGVYYSAAYADGDTQVVLYHSTDGLTWTAGPQIWAVAADTPLETELTFMPSGKLLALVRMDGDDNELLGDVEPLRTKICWSDPPYSSFSCPEEFDTERLDGPVSFFWQGRLFVIARKHLVGTGKKRTSLFEIGGTLEGGPLTIKEWGQLPSAGDTSYAGVAMIDPSHAVTSWYAGDLSIDQPWVTGMFAPTSIWLGTIDFSKLH
ncbi:MAG TPA: sialidase family protein [Polyangiaceae bacterium]